MLKGKKNVTLLQVVSERLTNLMKDKKKMYRRFAYKVIEPGRILYVAIVKDQV